MTDRTTAFIEQVTARSDNGLSVMSEAMRIDRAVAEIIGDGEGYRATISGLDTAGLWGDLFQTCRDIFTLRTQLLTYGIALSVKPEEQTLENATRILYEGETTIMLNAELTKNYLKLAAINAEMSSRGIDPLKDEGTSEDSRI